MKLESPLAYVHARFLGLAAVSAASRSPIAGIQVIRDVAVPRWVGLAWRFS
jgi:hypothetical protein